MPIGGEFVGIFLFLTRSDGGEHLSLLISDVVVVVVAVVVLDRFDELDSKSSTESKVYSLEWPLGPG